MRFPIVIAGLIVLAQIPRALQEAAKEVSLAGDIFWYAGVFGYVMIAGHCFYAVWKRL